MHPPSVREARLEEQTPPPFRHKPDDTLSDCIRLASVWNRHIVRQRALRPYPAGCCLKLRGTIRPPTADAGHIVVKSMNAGNYSICVLLVASCTAEELAFLVVEDKHAFRRSRSHARRLNLDPIRVHHRPKGPLSGIWAVHSTSWFRSPARLTLHRLAEVAGLALTTLRLRQMVSKVIQ